MVSLIIAIYNVGKYLDACLESAVNQSEKDLEIICVNDGSCDNSLQVLEDYARHDNRIVIIDKLNGGLSDARNAGLLIAKGEYIAFLDGDDTLEPGFISEMLDCMRKTESDLVCCNYSYRWLCHEEKVYKPFLNGLPEVLSREESIRAFLLQQIIGSVNIKLFKRNTIEEFGLRFPKGDLWEDMTFTLSYLLRAERVSIIHRSLYNYWQTGNSVSRTKDSLNILDQFKAVEGVIASVELNYGKNLSKETSVLFTKSFICVLIYWLKCTDRHVVIRLKEELEKREARTTLSGINISEKLLMLLYRLNYSLAKFFYIKIYLPVFRKNNTL